MPVQCLAIQKKKWYYGRLDVTLKTERTREKIESKTDCGIEIQPREIADEK